MNVHLLERHHISVPAGTWTDSCCTREVWQGAAGNLRPYADLRPVLSGPLHARKMSHTRRNAEDPVQSSRCELLRAEISGSQRDAPGRMERAIGREVFHQITLGIKNVHKATLRFVQGGVRHPNVAIDGLNSIWRKTSRDSRVAKRLRQTKCAIKDA